MNRYTHYQRALFMIILLSFAVMTSCKSFDPRILMTKGTLTNYCPDAVYINTESIKQCFKSDNEFNNLDRADAINILQNNLLPVPSNATISGSGTFLSVVVRSVKGSSNPFFLITGFGTGTLINLTGFPLAQQIWRIDLEAAVMSSDGKILKIYKGTGNDSEFCALFWGYPMSSSGDPSYDSILRRTAWIKALTNACIDLRNKISKEPYSLTQEYNKK